MIIVTGGAGFMRSNLINYLMKHGHDNVVSSDFLNKKKITTTLVNKTN